jgi:hypothetical protein
MGLVAAQFWYAFILEEVILKSWTLKRIFKLLRQKHLPKNKFKRVEIEIQSQSAWMGINTENDSQDAIFSGESELKIPSGRPSSSH